MAPYSGIIKVSLIPEILNWFEKTLKPSMQWIDRLQTIAFLLTNYCEDFGCKNGVHNIFSNLLSQGFWQQFPIYFSSLGESSTVSLLCSSENLLWTKELTRIYIGMAWVDNNWISIFGWTYPLTSKLLQNCQIQILLKKYMRVTYLKELIRQDIATLFVKLIYCTGYFKL